MRLVEKHNLEADRGLHTYRLGMNEYGDMVRTERYLCANQKAGSNSYTVELQWLEPRWLVYHG